MLFVRIRDGERCHTGEFIAPVRHLDGTDRFRPAEFVKRDQLADDSEEEESTVGKMPPGGDSDEET